MKKRKVALRKLILDKGIITDLSIATKEAIKGGATLPPTTPAGPDTLAGLLVLSEHAGILRVRITVKLRQ